MPTVGLVPLFRGKAIVVDFEPAIGGQARVVMRGIDGLIGRTEQSGASEEELVAAIPSFLALYGLSARLVARTREAIEFRVTAQ